MLQRKTLSVLWVRIYLYPPHIPLTSCRHRMLDSPDDSPGMEKLARQVDRGSIPLACVSPDPVFPLPMYSSTLQPLMGHLRRIHGRIQYRRKPQYPTHPTTTIIRSPLHDLLGPGQSFSPSTFPFNRVPCQCLYYGKNKSVKFTVPLVVGCLILMGGIEAAMIFAIRVRRRHTSPDAHTHPPSTSHPTTKATSAQSNSSVYSAQSSSL